MKCVNPLKMFGGPNRLPAAKLLRELHSLWRIVSLKFGGRIGRRGRQAGSAFGLQLCAAEHRSLAHVALPPCADFARLSYKYFGAMTPWRASEKSLNIQ